jgi:phage terminase Nu1 subunit (DNA packaging protein)
MQARLTREGKDVTSLRGEHVSGATVARAVVVLQELDREIRVKTHNKRSLDDLAQAVMRANSITTAEFVQLAESIIGESSVVLDSAVALRQDRMGRACSR